MDKEFTTVAELNTPKTSMEHERKRVIKARQCVDDGNSLLKQLNISGAINKYDQAIKKRPYYAIPHYNKRFALSVQNNISSTDNIQHKEINTNLLINKDQDITLTNRVDPYFVINIIAAVPKRTFIYDSSDEESDEEFNASHEKLVNNDWPFTTRQKKHIKFKTEVCFEPTFSCKNQDTADSKVVDPLLSKLLLNGFEVDDQHKLPNIAVSIGLNRMYSLSRRKNNSLDLELESKVYTTKIKYKKFGFYWKCNWYTKNGKEAKIEDVRKFYKQLKKKNPDLAKKFIEQEEDKVAECNVPYQDIREHAKNHSKTKELIKAFRDNNNNALVYLHLVDADVHDFNGVLSAYLRIIADCYKPPTVMSTGYEFPKDTQNKAYYLLGHMERMYRVITAIHIPFGTYYPEPNMCILIPQGYPTVEESFISHKRGNGKTLESPILLDNIQNNRQNVYAIFSEDNPIITNIPSRAKVSKRTKQLATFSPEFHKGPASPTFNDIKKYNTISQSHSESLTWIRSLFINNSIKYNSNYKIDGEYSYGKNNKRLSVINQCHHFISNIHKYDDDSSQSKLAEHIGKDDSKNIVNAIKDLNQFQKDFNEKYARTTEEQELIDILKKCKVSYNNLSRKSLLMIVTSQFMQLIKDEKINIQCLVDLDEDIIEIISNSDEIIQALYHKKVDFGDLIDLLIDYPDYLSRKSILMIATSQIMQLINDKKIDIQSLVDLDEETLEFICNSDKTIQALDVKDVDLDDLIDLLEDDLENFSTACDKDYSIQEIVGRYQADPLHLLFMANDPYDIVDEITTIDEEYKSEFAVNNHYISYEYLFSGVRR